MIPSNDDSIDDETIKEFALNIQEILYCIIEKSPFAAILLLDCCREYNLGHHNVEDIDSTFNDVELPQGLKVKRIFFFF